MYIESRTNERIKNVVKLRDKASREENRLFFFEGVHLLEEYLKHGYVPHSVFVCQNSKNDYSYLLNSINEDKIYTVSSEVFSKISTEKSPQGILTVSEFLNDNITILSNNAEYNIIKNNNCGILFLDSVRDNGNVGTIIRTAAAFGVTCVLSSDCADIYSSKTIRASMGAIFSSKLFITNNISETINNIRKNGRRVFASALGKTTLTLGKFEIKNNDCFVVGNEGNGINDKIISLCDSAVKIPMTDATESLNASAAAAILLWQIRLK